MNHCHEYLTDKKISIQYCETKYRDMSAHRYFLTHLLISSTSITDVSGGFLPVFEWRRVWTRGSNTCCPSHSPLVHFPSEWTGPLTAHHWSHQSLFLCSRCFPMSAAPPPPLPTPASRQRKMEKPPPSHPLCRLPFPRPHHRLGPRGQGGGETQADVQALCWGNTFRSMAASVGENAGRQWHAGTKTVSERTPAVPWVLDDSSIYEHAAGSWKLRGRLGNKDTNGRWLIDNWSKWLLWYWYHHWRRAIDPTAETTLCLQLNWPHVWLKKRKKGRKEEGKKERKEGDKKGRK